jgi:hypothetical protein
MRLLRTHSHTHGASNSLQLCRSFSGIIIKRTILRCCRLCWPPLPSAIKGRPYMQYREKKDVGRGKEKGHTGSVNYNGGVHAVKKLLFFKSLTLFFLPSMCLFHITFIIGKFNCIFTLLIEYSPHFRMPPNAWNPFNLLTTMIIYQLTHWTMAIN